MKINGSNHEVDSQSAENKKIVVTGAAGFIGSCMVQYLNEMGFTNLILVDDFSYPAKKENWQTKHYANIIERRVFFDWLGEYEPEIAVIIHLGARTDTTEFNYAIHQELNVEYSQRIWNYCVTKQIPLLYASSAATYGGGEHGYNDDHFVVEKLQPLNPYGISKNEFDKWALAQQQHPPYWVGLKFFNVYGPNEYHKGRMASVIFHSFNQIKNKGEVKLFRSHRAEFKDGEQLRDFVYVKDVVKVIGWIAQTMQNGNWLPDKNGLYNLGTGEARSFYDLASSTFGGLNLAPNITFINMPDDIRDKYQYYTQANIQKLRNAGYRDDFYTLEEGVKDYVQNYLATNNIY